MNSGNGNSMFEEVYYLPRWAYHIDEWRELIHSVDKIIGNRFFRLIKEPVPDELDIIIEEMMKE